MSFAPPEPTSNVGDVEPFIPQCQHPPLDGAESLFHDTDRSSARQQTASGGVSGLKSFGPVQDLRGKLHQSLLNLCCLVT